MPRIRVEGKNKKKKQQDEDVHHGALCSRCGRTVTEDEYTSGTSRCCKKDVCDESEYK